MSALFVESLDGRQTAAQLRAAVIVTESLKWGSYT
jgi:hypothetical protein